MSISIKRKQRKQRKHYLSKRNKHTQPTKKKRLGKQKKQFGRKFKKEPIVLFATKKMADDVIKKKEGDYFDSSHYDIIVRDNCDCYYNDENNNKLILFKFRKNVIPLEHCMLGIKNLKEAAQKKHDNRGPAAGKIDLKKMPSYANQESQLIGRNKFRVHSYRSRKNGKIIKSSLGNISQSNIIGYYDKPDRNIRLNKIPCRTTAFTSQQVDKWLRVIPLIRSINNQFKNLTPKNYNIQYKQANDTEFVIKDTAFSTVTINHNWRTALHKDNGDLKEGFGNLVVLEEGKYEGGETGFPQYKVAIDVRHGDFLAMNVHEWHCNTQIKPITKDYTRLSMVAYLREKMIKCRDIGL